MGNPAFADKPYSGLSTLDSVERNPIPREFEEVKCVGVGAYSSFDIANYFIQLSNQKNGEWLTPLLLEKLTVFADQFSLSMFNQRLINEVVIKDEYGMYFANLREYLRLYTHDTLITNCFSNLPPFEDFLTSKTQKNTGSLLGFSCQEKQTLNAIYKYGMNSQCDWYALSQNMPEHIRILSINWGKKQDAT